MQRLANSVGIFMLVVVGATVFEPARANEDWPMWRYDASRSAASPNALPEQLELLWKRPFSARKQAWDDPLNLDLMTYDQIFEPIVMDGRMFVGFNDQDKLLALDTATGKELWTFFAEGPIRLPPVGWQESVFACSDDGYLYCIDASDGSLRWKFSGAPNSQHAIGNRRLISAWPARGGPVIRDGVVYFACSIWPFMGTFIYALDAQTGNVQWVNDSSGSQYIQQPHSAPSFAGVAPQGALVATDTLLIVPGGRSVPAVLDRATGKLKYFEINAGGKGTGGSFVTADATHFYVHTREKGTRAFDLATGLKTAFMPNRPVVDGRFLYSAETDGKRHIIRAYQAGIEGDKAREPLWETEVAGTGDLILVGDCLIAAGNGKITGIQLAPDRHQPAAGETPTASPVGSSAAELETIFRLETDEEIARLIVANHRLFAVGLSGTIVAYGVPSAALRATKATPAAGQSDPRVNERTRMQASELLAAGDPAGYALWFGECDAETALEISRQAGFEQLAIVHDQTVLIENLRVRLDAADAYGRVTAHVASPEGFRAPPYIANMIFVSQSLAEKALAEGSQASVTGANRLRTMYSSLRPYGGVMQVLARDNVEAIADGIRSLHLEQAEVETGPQGVIVRRVGPLPGASDWTHQYGDVANSLKSNDSRVKLPLGILWFGGSSNMDVLPRHGHGPPEQVVAGRLVIQGMNSLSARDVYTGRVLWQREFEDLGTYDVFYDATYDDAPLDPKYNQVHIPGANGRGTNYVVTEDRIYLVIGASCKILDPASGQDMGEITLPTDESGQLPEWGYIGVYQDVLIGGVGFAQYRQQHALEFESDQKLSSSKAGFGSKSLDRAASRALIGFDRRSGRQLWRIDAQHSFWHNGIVAGGNLVYCLDKNPEMVEEALRRRGLETPQTYRIVALDANTGQTQWQITDGIFGTWLGYSEQHKLLLQAGARASDRLQAEVGQGMRMYNAADGSLRWKIESLDYAGPCILHNDWVITNANSYSESAGAFDILTGRQRMVKHPLTGEILPWKMTRAYGCNNIIASENLLTFRSGAAGYYDLLTDSGTGNLGGFKSGCTSNLVVANGVLNAPDYTRTCSCAYQNQTSLALVHMPEVETWSVNALANAMDKDSAIRNLAINFGAAGDRPDASGTLWLEYPPVAGDSPPLSIRLNKNARFFQHHSSAASNASLPWIFSSGVELISDLDLELAFAPQKDDQPIITPDTAEQATKAEELHPYDIDFYFASQADSSTTPCVFDIFVQEQLMAAGVRLPSVEQGGIVHSIPGVQAGHTIRIRFKGQQSQPTLCGVHIRRTSN